MTVNWNVNCKIGKSAVLRRHLNGTMGAYRKDGSLAGHDLERENSIPTGLFHIVSEVLVKHADGTYSRTQCDRNKPNYPGLFEASAGGSGLKGENPYQGAVRELREETGIYPDDFTLIGAQSNLKDTCYVGFLCITDCRKDSILLQENETISYRRLEEAEFLNYMNCPVFVPNQRRRWLPFLNKIFQKSERSV